MDLSQGRVKFQSRNPFHDTNICSTLALEPAKVAFQEGLKIFKQQLTEDPRKRELVNQLQTTSLQDVLDSVVAAKLHYEERCTSNKARDCLSAFSKRVHHYGHIMDVMVEHHPEYASLVWGAMKLFFGVGKLLFL